MLGQQRRRLQKIRNTGGRLLFVLSLLIIANVCFSHESCEENSILAHKKTKKQSSSNDAIQEAPIFIKSQVQSTWKCAGNLNHESEWRWRTCAFKNICYDKEKKVFQFYRNPTSSKKPILFEPGLGHVYEFNMNNHGFVSLVSRADNQHSWGPKIVEELLPSSNEVPYIEDVHVLFMHWYAPYNPGHIIWEDIASTYLAMVRLDEYSPNAVLLRLGNFWPEGNIFSIMYESLVPAFASKVHGIDHYMNNFSSPTVCFRTVVAGGSTPVFSLDREHFTHGKERHLYAYRSAILTHHGIDLLHPPTKHRITLVNKTASKRQSLRAIKNLGEVSHFIKKTYPLIELQVVEWHKLTFREQLREVHKTTILITPSGGVSCIVPFLPKGAHAIITDYYVNEEAHILGERWKVGESGSMDAALWNYFPHFHKLYYQVRGPDDFVFVSDQKNNSRHDVMIVIKMDRLKELIETAIENSGDGSIY